MIPKDFDITLFLTENQLGEIKRAFEVFDKDKSGSITSQELDQILKSLGQYLENIDFDKNGLIQFNEFVYIAAGKLLKNRSDYIYIEAFNVMDFDGDGIITEEDLQKCLNFLGKDINIDDIKDMIDYACVDEQGITLPKFLSLMLRKF